MPKSLLCVTVTGSSMAELRQQRDAVEDADLVELRLDFVADPNVAGALAGRRRPVILTCRPAWEGGHFSGSEEERKRLLADALALGAEYVDIEWRAGFDDLIAQRAGRGIVLSSHDFAGVPDDVPARLHAMRSTGAEVVKVAVKPNTLAECASLLEIGTEAARHGPAVLIGMGECGLATRVLPGRFGSIWTYAGPIRAIGQPDASSLLEDYQFRSLGNSPAVYGIVAKSVKHSVSTAIHNAAFSAARLDAVYLPFPAASADDFVTFGRALGIKGASVTIPYKVALFDRMDEVYAVARRVGAINTIRTDESGRWIGGNTDVHGFLRPLQQRIKLTGLRAAVLGAGGAARAIAVALSSSGCTVRIHARNAAQSEGTALFTSSEVGPWPPEPGSWDLLVNCTPVGMYPHVNQTPLPADHLTGRYVYDLIYNPGMTRLMRDAAAVGCETIGGLEMLVAQAHEQFQWWTGSKAPAGVMREAAEKRLAELMRDEHHVV